MAARGREHRYLYLSYQSLAAAPPTLTSSDHAHETSTRAATSTAAGTRGLTQSGSERGSCCRQGPDRDRKRSQGRHIIMANSYSGSIDRNASHCSFHDLQGIGSRPQACRPHSTAKAFAATPSLLRPIKLPALPGQRNAECTHRSRRLGRFGNGHRHCHGNCRLWRSSHRCASGT